MVVILLTESTHQGAGQSGAVAQLSTTAAADESSSNQGQEDETMRSDAAYDGTPRTAETVSQFQGSTLNLIYWLFQLALLNRGY